MPDAGLRAKRATRSELRRIEAAVRHGLHLAAEAGRESPGLRDAVWELLLEAGDTLKRLPDRERGWLTAATRAHWPDSLSGVGEVLIGGAPGGATAGTGPARRPGPAGGEAIDRLDTVLPWLPLAAGRNRGREVAVLFGLACGLRVAALRRFFGCGRSTVYDLRDRGLARICGRLRAQSAFCRALP
ncbi:MAG: hypothetical protein ACFCUW_16000 [Kiloniellaceae bacterium]